MPLSSENAAALLRRYEIEPFAGDARSWRYGSVELALGGHRRADGQKMLTLTIGNVAQSRTCPFREGDAADMVTRFRERQMLPSDASTEQAVTKLITSASRLYAGEAIESFVLQPVYIEDGNYRIESVRMFETPPRSNAPRSNLRRSNADGR